MFTNANQSFRKLIAEVFAISAVLAWCSSAVAVAPAYEFRELSPVGPIWPVSISDDGLILARDRIIGAGGAITLIPARPGWEPTTIGRGGVVLGTESYITPNGVASGRIVKYAGGDFTTIYEHPEGLDIYSFGKISINSSGVVAASYSTSWFGWAASAVIIDPSRSEPTFIDGMDVADIDEMGRVTGTCQRATAVGVCRWDGSSLSVLVHPDLSLGYPTLPIAVAANEAGRIVGFSGYFSDDGISSGWVPYEWFLAGAGNSAVQLPILSGDPRNSLLTGIDSSGNAVGRVAERGAVYIGHDGSDLSGHPALKPSNWGLPPIYLESGGYADRFAAFSLMNEAGQIVGFHPRSRADPGQIHVEYLAFVLTPVPEPKSALLLFAGFLFLLAGRSAGRLLSQS